MYLVLVTGGCGFIGSHFIRHLLAHDPDVHIVNLDCLTYAGRMDNLADLGDRARLRLVRGDITDRAVVRRTVGEQIRAIVHFAAESHVDRSIHDSGPFMRTNVLGTQVLLDAAREYQVERFVQISTDEVYGTLGVTGKFAENSPLAPRNPYSASKAAADLLVRSYVSTYGVPAVIARSSNNYGPYQHLEKVIPRFILNLLRDEPVPLYGDGLHVRDWLHVRDNVAGLHAVWRRGRIGEIYNIGGGCEITNLQLTHLLLEMLDKPASLIHHVPDRPGHDRRYALDSTKMHTELGWRPTIPFADGLRETVRWYREHGDWVARCQAALPQWEVSSNS